MRKSPHARVVNQKCREIIKAITKRCDDPNVDKCESVVGFTRDWGGNSLTVLIDGGHTHVGDPEHPFWMLVEDLHALLTSGFGLSVHRGLVATEEAKRGDG